MKLLELKDVSYKYPKASKYAIKNINISFEAGKLYCIMGKSGAGKSTMLSLMSGLDSPTEGQIFYDGHDIKNMNMDEYRARKIGIIFQGYNLLTNATALENIELAMNISGHKIKDKKEAAFSILEKVSIDGETARRKILNLSGGEQQRIGIARAISHNPSIVIADEPTGNLDGETWENIMDILSSLAKNENKCVIVVTHSKEVASYADELWGINAGQLAFVK